MVDPIKELIDQTQEHENQGLLPEGYTKKLKKRLGLE